MKIYNKNTHSLYQFCIFAVAVIFILHAGGCKKYLEVDVQRSQITKDIVFSNDITATSALTGVYNEMISSQQAFASGSQYSITAMCALSSDEMLYAPLDADFKSVQENALSAINPNILSLWQSMYSAIYGANAVLSGLDKSTTLTISVKKQLKGEALFIRAFAHFYLVNLFGEVPVVTTTDYNINAKVARQPVDSVYQQIIADLSEASVSVAEDYVTSERVRPNKFTIDALLARIYLYRGDWINAELKASEIIGSGKYLLEADLADVFLSDSEESIWQLMPHGESFNTYEGFVFILQGPPLYAANPFYLREGLYSQFNGSDLRRAEWIDSIKVDGTIYRYPFKYKIRIGGSLSNPAVPLTEYSMVFRLAEQYLIRAEARAEQNKLAEAIADIDMIRVRAGIAAIADTDPGISKDNLVLAIAQERRLELFTEWGHRWFDLKRTGRANAELGSKPGWSADDQLYPLPQIELDKNKFL